MQHTRQHGGLRRRAWVETQDRQVECELDNREEKLRFERHFCTWQETRTQQFMLVVRRGSGFCNDILFTIRYEDPPELYLKIHVVPSSKHTLCRL